MSKEKSTPRSYSQCMARLQELVGQLDETQVDVDRLEDVVKESVDLITTCRERLRATQSAVDTLLAGLAETPTEPAPRQTPVRIAPSQDALPADLLDLADPFAD